MSSINNSIDSDQWHGHYLDQFVHEFGTFPGPELFRLIGNEERRRSEAESVWSSELKNPPNLDDDFEISILQIYSTISNNYDRRENIENMNGDGLSEKSIHAGTQEKGSILPQMPTPPDGGYGWVIVVMTFLVNFSIFGVIYSWGIYQDIYINKVFHGRYSTLAISFVGSLGSSFPISIGFLVQPILARIGTQWTLAIGTLLTTVSLILASFAIELWHIFLTQGLLFGIGASFVWFPSIVCLQQWFLKRRGVATGIAIAGSGIGGLALSPLVSTVTAQFDYRWSLRVLALFAIVLLTIATIFLKPLYIVPPQVRNQMKPKLIDFKIITPKLRLLMVAGFIITFGYLAPFFMLNTYARFIGVSPSLAATTSGIMSGVNSVARILLGLAADRIGRMNTIFLCTFIAGLVTMIIWPLAKTFDTLMAFVVLYGFFGGGYVSLFPATIADLVPLKDIATASGMLYLSSLFGNLFGTPIAGALFDATGRKSFVPLAEFCGAATLLGSLVILAVRFWLNPNPLKKV
ncbi:uncharacterized protein VTP21DRAFT_1468 [Calcarisporiella thermophila]|uniref:uncharacterized protein n=1 Tax=Calcarisporiella thermophila TaxID=911321 RepID=UPI003744544C